MFRFLSETKHHLLQRLGVSCPSREDLPDFLGIGAPQCATTWLHANLDHHPEVYFPGGKELNYFDRHFWLPLSWYRKAFRPGRSRVKGEVTAGYCALPRHAIEVMGQILPDVKLLLILRDPVERSWSAARRVLSWTHGPELRGVGKKRLLRFFDRRDVRVRSRYGAMLSRWRAVYPTDQILILWYDQVAAQPRKLLRRTFEHLGVDPHVDLSTYPVARRINRNPRHAIPDAVRSELRRRYRADLRLLRRHLETWDSPATDPGRPAWL